MLCRKSCSQPGILLPPASLARLFPDEPVPGGQDAPSKGPCFLLPCGPCGSLVKLGLTGRAPQSKVPCWLLHHGPGSFLVRVGHAYKVLPAMGFAASCIVGQSALWLTCDLQSSSPGNGPGCLLVNPGLKARLLPAKMTCCVLHCQSVSFLIKLGFVGRATPSKVPSSILPLCQTCPLSSWALWAGLFLAWCHAAFCLMDHMAPCSSWALKESCSQEVAMLLPTSWTRQFPGQAGPCRQCAPSKGAMMLPLVWAWWHRQLIVTFFSKT